MLTVAIGRPEAFVVGSEGNFKAIVVDHSHPFGGPEMSGEPLNLIASHLVGTDQHSSFPDVLSALGELLHSFGFSKFLLHVFPHLSGNPESVVAHCSPSDRLRKRLVTFFLGVHFEVCQKLVDFDRSVLDKFIEIDMPGFIFHITFIICDNQQ